MDSKISKIFALVRGSSRLWIVRAVVAYISFKILRAHVKWHQQLRNIERMGYPVLPFRKGWLGSIPAMVENFDNVYEFRRKCHERYGDTFSWVAPIWNSDPQVSTRDPRIVKHILQDNFENYLKSPMLTKALSTLLGNGIFAINHGELGFGVDLDTLSKDEVPFASAFDSVQTNISKRIYQPFWEVPLLRYIYSSERQIDRDMAILDSFCSGIISERLAESKEKVARRGDILSLFVQADNQLPKQYLRNILMSFFIAGRAENPLVQEKLAKEVLNACSSKDAFVTLDELKNLKYLDGVVKECLRLYPPVAVDGKRAEKADVLPDGTSIPAGTRIAFEIYSMGRDPSVYESPDSVLPERWYGKSSTPFEFPVFQGGPRICLGKDLATYEAKFVVAEIIKRYRFDLPGPIEEPRCKPGITITVKNGCKLLISRR